MGTHIGIWEDYLNFGRIVIAIFTVIDIHCYYGDPYWDPAFQSYILLALDFTLVSCRWTKSQRRFEALEGCII